MSSTLHACPAFEQDLVLYLYGECSNPEKGRLETHLQSCAGCRGFLQELKSFLPSTVETDEPPATFWQDYSREMRIKLAEHEERRGSWHSIAAIFRPWPLPALAAGLIIAIGVTISLSNGRRAPERPASPQLVEMATNADFFKSMDLLDSVEFLEAVEAQEAQKGEAAGRHL